MSLEIYDKMRNFAVTLEPKGKPRRKNGNSFVVQKHDATRLHYDFRLELDGVLLSWAVTKGPSLVVGEKRLAVHVEDHPLDYGGFEGTIPKGEYGGGTVIIWDKGTWTPFGDAHKAYAKGHLEFDLHGQKLQGRWHLVRMQGKPGEKRENWLLIKADDPFARPPDAPDILQERPESVNTGQMIGNVAVKTAEKSSKAGKITSLAPKPRTSHMRPVEAGIETKAMSADVSGISGAKKASVPTFVDPMLASLAAKPPQGERWLHEIKFDGYRLQARIEAGRVKLLTRGGLDWTKKFGKSIVADLHNLAIDSAVIDGEVVVETDTGASDFSALQADLSEGRSERFIYYAFDLMFLDGYDLRSLPLITRKTALGQILAEKTGFLRYSDHFDESGATVLRHACGLSLEGIVSKLKDAPYRSGRSKNWQKSKCSFRQEFVIAGYVPSSVYRGAIGSLVLGVYEDAKLHHIGRVGTGFTATMAATLFSKLERLRVTSNPFQMPLTPDEARSLKYVRPDLVAEVEFDGWSAAGHLRHASFCGLREDKKAIEIVRETPKPANKPSATQHRTVQLTHPDRIYWPDDGVSKEGLADYYSEVWHHMAPFVVDRPLALLRCPEGITGEKFFQKHAWKGLNPNITLVNDPTESGVEPLISIKTLDGLLSLVQAAAMEIHTWGSTVADWERPDMIVMDLDPGEDVGWSAIIAAAGEVRDRLVQNGLAAFVKTSGGKGLHVICPLKPGADWISVKNFTKAIAEKMALDSPNLYVATITKSKRHGKILIDYLRNQRGATAVAPFSTRARPGAAVSAPLAWNELGPAIGPAYFTVTNMPTRLASLSVNPWEDFHASAKPLEYKGMRPKKKT